MNIYKFAEINFYKLLQIRIFVPIWNKSMKHLEQTL